VIPDSCTHLTFGCAFNQPLQPGVIPKSCIHLTFDSDFNKPLIPGVIPKSCTDLTFGNDFNQPLEPAKLTSVTKIMLNVNYSHVLPLGFNNITLWHSAGKKENSENINKILVNYNYEIGPKKEIDKKFLIPIRLKLNQRLQEQIKLHYQYRPNGTGYFEAEAHFNELKNQLNK
jgi:hypothetical protein